MIIVLPWPPSLNHYWRHARGQHYISARGKAYRKEVWALVPSRPRYTGRLSVSVELVPPNRRRFDVDNRMKGLLDALAYAGIYEDDEQIDVLHVRRMAVDPPGRCTVIVEHIS